MALIKCPECGNTVSNKAEVCPHCGIKIAGAIDSKTVESVQSTQPVQPVQPQVTEQPVQSVQTVQPQVAQQPVQPRPAVQRQPVAEPEREEEKPKKSPMLMVISFVIALGIFGAGFYYYQKAEQNKEMEAYEDAMRSDDPAVLSAYLSHYNDAPREHRDSVNAHLTAMQSLDSEWYNVSHTGSKAALVDFLQKHPDTHHKSEALAMIDSIDFAIAQRKNDSEAYAAYLKEHPDGKYADIAQSKVDSQKATEVQPAEMTLTRTVMKHFFQAINSKSEAKLIETVADYLGSFLNRSNASSDDVVTFMKRLYKDEDITNMNWHILDDFKVEKVSGADGQVNFKATFDAEQKIDRTDAAKMSYAKYQVTAEVTSDGKIVKFNMKKLESK